LRGIGKSIKVPNYTVRKKANLNGASGKCGAIGSLSKLTKYLDIYLHAVDGIDHNFQGATDMCPASINKYLSY